jgi:hypothetical protein
MSIYLENNSDFEEWCIIKGYDGDNEIDFEEEVHKRGSHASFYVKKIDADLYAEVSCSCDYDWGRSGYEIHRTGLVRTEEQIVRTQVVYKQV